MTAKLPKRDSDQVQHLRATTRLNVGAPQLSRTALETWDKIVETVFLALLATTIGTLLAVPLSFFAAFNLMKDVSSPVTAVALNLLLLPVGFLLGTRVAGAARELTNQVVTQIGLNLAGMIVGLALAYLAVRWAVPPEDVERPSRRLRLARMLVLLAAAILGLFVLYLFSNSLILVGTWLEGKMGWAGFIGRFIADLGDILGMLLTIISALIGVPASSAVWPAGCDSGRSGPRKTSASTSGPAGSPGRNFTPRSRTGSGSTSSVSRDSPRRGASARISASASSTALQNPSDVAGCKNTSAHPSWA